MRNIQVDLDVFSAIWQARKGDESDENEILRGVFNIDAKSGPASSSMLLPALSSSDKAQIGFYDTRNDVTFMEGATIFRNFKGVRYDAVASNGHWVRLDTGKPYRSLNKLNLSITPGAQNVWDGTWRFIDFAGKNKSIGDLRPR